MGFGVIELSIECWILNIEYCGNLLLSDPLQSGGWHVTRQPGAIGDHSKVDVM